MLRAIIAFVSVSLLAYLMWSFYNLTFDFSKWPDEARFLFLGLGVFTCGGFAGYMTLISEGEK